MEYHGEILLDKNAKDKERPWKIHKTNSQLLSESYKRLKLRSKAERVCSCGSTLKFNVCPSGHEKKLSWANFCRVRLCPMCSWRRSLLNAYQLKLVAHHSAQKEKIRWLFLTLTIKNCESNELKTTLDKMMKAWNKLNQYKIFKNNVKGWYRGLEITRNPFDGTYHPHYHVLLAVNPSYFKGENYIKQLGWVKMWQTSLEVDYVPVVDIRAVKNNAKNIENEKKILDEKGIEFSELDGSTVAELSKYTTKASDVLIYNDYEIKPVKKKIKMVADLKSGIDEEKTDENIWTLDAALNRRRLNAYGGLLKKVWQQLREDGRVQDIDDENVDLVHVNSDDKCKCSACGSDMLEEIYNWIPGQQNYIKKEYSPEKDPE